MKETKTWKELLGRKCSSILQEILIKNCAKLERLVQHINLRFCDYIVSALGRNIYCKQKPESYVFLDHRNRDNSKDPFKGCSFVPTMDWLWKLSLDPNNLLKMANYRSTSTSTISQSLNLFLLYLSKFILLEIIEKTINRNLTLRFRGNVRNLLCWGTLAEINHKFQMSFCRIRCR